MVILLEAKIVTCIYCKRLAEFDETSKTRDNSRLTIKLRIDHANILLILDSKLRMICTYYQHEPSINVICYSLNDESLRLPLSTSSFVTAVIVSTEPDMIEYGIPAFNDIHGGYQ